MLEEKVRLAIMAPTLNFCNYLFGIKGGYFLQEGLEVEVIIRPGRQNAEAVARGEADFGAANECVIQEALQGPTDLKILLQVLKDPLHDLIVGPEIGSLQDLGGKRVATPRAGSTPAVQTRMLFENNGLLPDRDVFLVPQALGKTMEDRISQFEQGLCEGLIASPPFPFLLHRKGFKSLTELSAHFPGTASHGLVATSASIARRPAVVEAMVRGFVRGVTALRADRKAALDFISEYYQLEPSVAAQGYDLLKDRWTAELSLKGLGSEIAFHARIAGSKPISPERITEGQFAHLASVLSHESVD
jgi:ABC-type nitrate/sulfonate/bicarbonate transport system substrate-binding protein